MSQNAAAKITNKNSRVLRQKRRKKSPTTRQPITFTPSKNLSIEPPSLQHRFSYPSHTSPITSTIRPAVAVALRQTDRSILTNTIRSKKSSTLLAAKPTKQSAHHNKNLARLRRYPRNSSTAHAMLVSAHKIYTPSAITLVPSKAKRLCEAPELVDRLGKDHSNDRHPVRPVEFGQSLQRPGHTLVCRRVPIAAFRSFVANQNPAPAQFLKLQSHPATISPHLGRDFFAQPSSVGIGVHQEQQLKHHDRIDVIGHELPDVACDRVFSQPSSSAQPSTRRECSEFLYISKTI